MRYLIAIIVLFFLFGCEKSSTPIDQESVPISNEYYQIPGCQGQTDNLAKTFSNDYCFSYSWINDLNVELCLWANCCPDTDRFNSSSVLTGNVISVTVTDTAKQLCDCICTYKLHFDFPSLLKKDYIFKCIYNDSLVYIEKIKKP